MTACCGAKVAPGSARSVAPVASAQVPTGATPTGMVLLEYVGGNVGSSMWGGPGGAPSNRYYQFGNNQRDKIKYVATQDLEWALGLRDGGRPMLQRYNPPEPAPVPQMVSAPEITIPPGTEELGAAVVEAILANNPDPSALTVAQIKELTLSPAQWAALAELEAAGKSRRTVIEYATGQANVSAAN